MIKNVWWSSCKVPLLFMSDFNETWIFLTDFWKNTEMPNFIKIRPVGAELFHADRRTDVTKLIVAFRDFANSPAKFAMTVHWPDWNKTKKKKYIFCLIILQKLTTYIQSPRTVISISTFSCSCVCPLHTPATLHPVNSVAQCRLFHGTREISFQAQFPLTFFLFICWLFICLTVLRAFFYLDCLFLLWLILERSWVKYFTFSNASCSL